MTYANIKNVWVSKTFKLACIHQLKNYICLKRQNHANSNICIKCIFVYVCKIFPCNQAHKIKKIIKPLFRFSYKYNNYKAAIIIILQLCKESFGHHDKVELTQYVVSRAAVKNDLISSYIFLQLTPKSFAQICPHQQSLHS